ncbi:hypothetical protein BKA65DRAFT_476670 [Rhexocercosporidium sp. MPI-PUGE-AT-0058]|nr:hypothetical protein BKA65DRAFT_476670 [Rhexocercosporidium sp. MPI-PUGE-AT-0058]
MGIAPLFSTELIILLFCVFSEFPREIQLKIWQHAVPDPRSVLGTVRIILDFDLSTPRAILPSIRELKRSYRFMHNPQFAEDEEDTDEDSGDSDQYSDESSDVDGFYSSEETIMWKPSDITMAVSRRPVFALLHACKLARVATLERYKLSTGSEIEEENIPWWVPEEDMVIFVGHGFRERLTWVHWLFRARAEPLPVFESLEHLALASERTLEDYLISGSLKWHLDEDWLPNFPALQSFTLLLDPVLVLDRKAGRILLHEPEEEPVYSFGGYRPAEIVKRLTIAFEEALPSDMEVPLVEVFVAGWKRG